MSAPVENAVDIGTIIVRSPAVRNGEPHIAGTGMTVKRIAGYFNSGLSAEEIAHEIPHLAIGQIYAALAYYHANRREIDALIAREEAEHNRLAREAAKR